MTISDVLNRVEKPLHPNLPLTREQMERLGAHFPPTDLAVESAYAAKRRKQQLVWQAKYRQRRKLLRAQATARKLKT